MALSPLKSQLLPKAQGLSTGGSDRKSKMVLEEEMDMKTNVTIINLGNSPLGNSAEILRCS